MKELTAKQQELLNFISNHQKRYNVPPTFVEMSTKLGVSMAAIQSRLNALERKIIIKRKSIYIINSK
jgi:SOS-response transcriptional repressor LexA